MKISAVNTLNYKQNFKGMHTSYPKDDYNGIRFYCADIAKYPLITREEEIELSKIIKKGGKEAEEAKQKLILSNLRIPIRMAKKYDFSRLQMEDLIQIGNIGLISAASEAYNSDFSFSTFAYSRIAGAINYEFKKNNRIIRLPANIVADVEKLKKFISSFEEKHNRKPTDKEISIANKLSKKKLQILMRYMKPELSLNEILFFRDIHEKELSNFIKDEQIPNPAEVLELKELKQDIKKALKTSKLTKNQKAVIKSLFGLTDNNSKPVNQCARDLGITRQRVRQLLLEAIRKLRKNPYIKSQHDFLKES